MARQPNTISHFLPWCYLRTVTASTCNPSVPGGSGTGPLSTPLPLRCPNFFHQCTAVLVSTDKASCLEPTSRSILASHVALGLYLVLPYSEIILRRPCLCAYCSHFLVPKKPLSLYFLDQVLLVHKLN